jgi:uncharacterized cupin superfamily protein
MIGLHLAQWLLSHAAHAPGGVERTIAVIAAVSRIAPRTAAVLLDRFPEADRAGMQVFALDAAGLRAEGTRDGVTHTRPRLHTIDGAIASGEWDSGPARHVIKFDFDEWVHVLEGEAHVTVQNVTRTIKAGDIALFRAGLSMTWNVPRYIRKVWVHRYPQPTLIERAGRLIEKLAPGLGAKRRPG